MAARMVVLVVPGLARYDPQAMQMSVDRLVQ